MKTILVPTDFSPVADNALQYASEMNKLWNAEIVIYHSSYVPVSLTPGGAIYTDDAALHKVADENLKAVIEKIKARYPGQQYATKTGTGLGAQEIVAEQKNGSYDLIIMGTKGASGAEEILIGSVTASVIENSSCPVIAIPGQARMNGINKVVFAVDYGKDPFKNALKIIDLLRNLNPEIILFHLTDGKPDEIMEYGMLEKFKDRLIQESHYQSITFRLFESPDVYDGLNKYITEFNIDMVAISMRNRNIFEKLFSRSLTKKMVYHSHIPVLALHENESE